VQYSQLIIALRGQAKGATGITEVLRDHLPNHGGGIDQIGLGSGDPEAVNDIALRRSSALAFGKGQLSRPNFHELIRLKNMNAAQGKVLISGSSGLIGAALVRQLAAEGWQITRLIRTTVSAANQISWDPSKSILPESVSGFDAVIHLAGESIAERWTEARKQAIRDSRVVGTRNISEALARSAKRPTLLLAASAIGYYGDRGDEVLTEQSSAGRGFLAEVCGEWESATQAAAEAGIRTVQARFGVVLARSGGALPKMLTPFRLGIGGNLGSGRQWWSWVALDDVIGAIEHILQTDTLEGPVNVVSPNPVTNREFTKNLASVLSRPAVFPVPAFAARMALGQMADPLLLASQRVDPAKLRSSGYRFQHTDLRRALEAILRK
jgi:uncharacterized protein